MRVSVLCPAPDGPCQQWFALSLPQFPHHLPAPRPCGEPSGTGMPGAAGQHMQPRDVGPRSVSYSGPQSRGPGDPPGQSGHAGALATLPQGNSTIRPRRMGPGTPAAWTQCWVGGAGRSRDQPQRPPQSPWAAPRGHPSSCCAFSSLPWTSVASRSCPGQWPPGLAGPPPPAQVLFPLLGCQDQL